MSTIESPITLGIAIIALVVAIYSERQADKAWRAVQEELDKADEQARQAGIPRGHYDWKKNRGTRVALLAIGILIVVIVLLIYGIILNLTA